MKKQERFPPVSLPITLSTFVLYPLQQAEMNGEDYERVKLLEISAVEMEKSMRKKTKKNPDTGFAGMTCQCLV